MALKPIRDVSSLTDRVYESIREGIMTLELKPGTQLVESRLAEALGTSKTPIRQALQQLEPTGLVVAVPYRGYSVSKLTIDDAYEILQIRSVLEGLAVSEACPRLTEGDFRKLDEFIALQRETLDEGDLDKCAEYGHQFHRLLIDRAGNERLSSMIDILNDQFHRIRLLSSHVPGRLPRSIEEHTRILEALKMTDSYRAEYEMRSHLLAVFASVQQDDVLGEDPDDGNGDENSAS